MGKVDKNNKLIIEISWKSIFRVAVALVTFWAVIKLQNLIVYLLFSILFSVALHPLVKKMQSWGLRRGFALAFTLMAVVGAFLVLIGFAVSSLVASVIDLVVDLPRYLDQFQTNETLAPVALEVKTFIQNLNVASVLQNGLTTGSSLISGASKIFEIVIFIFFFTVYMLLENEYLIRLVRSIIPEDWQDESTDLMGEATEVIGGYIRGQFITSFLLGVVSYLIFRALGLPNAAALAVIAAISDIIPVIGGFIGLIPAVIVALTVSPLVALATVIFVQTYSTLNNHYISPRVYGQSMDLSPFLVALATTAGLMLFGAPGILLALPVAAIVGYGLTKYKGIPIIEEDQE